MKILLLIIPITLIAGCQLTKTEKRQNSKTERHEFFWSVNWHPAEDQFVAGGSNDKLLRLFSSVDFQPIGTYPYLGTITKTKWHPTKNKLAVSVQDGKSKSAILNFDNDERIELDSVTNFGARAIGWNRSGNLLAVGDYEGALTFFDEDGNYLKKVDTGQKGIIGLDWHPDEDLLVAVGEKIALYRYDSDSLYQINHRNEAVEVLMLCVAWHPGGEFFVTGDYGDFQYHYPPLLQYWTYDGRLRKTIRDSKAEIRNISWSKDGKILATASDQLRLRDENGNLRASAKTENLLWGIDWNEEGTRIITTDNGGNIFCWDANLNILTKLQP